MIRFFGNWTLFNLGVFLHSPMHVGSLGTFFEGILVAPDLAKGRVNQSSTSAESKCLLLFLFIRVSAYLADIKKSLAKVLQPLWPNIYGILTCP